MKVLVTGGGGFLGSTICRQLREEGHDVLSFSRRQYPTLTKLGIEQFRGDITSFHDLHKAMAGVHAVIHCAAKVGVWGRKEQFVQTNIVGTENVLRACYYRQVKKLVYTSTPSVVSQKGDLCQADERTPYPESYLAFYPETKAYAEQKVLKANGKNGLATTALRPHLIMGPGDPNLLPRLLEAHAHKRLAIIGNGKNKVDIIHVENAARAHLLALSKLNLSSALAGQAYFLGQEKAVELWPFLNKIFIKKGLPPLKKKIPFPVAYALGGAVEKGLSLLNKYDIEPPMTRFVAVQLSHSHYFSHKKAKRDLGPYDILSTEQLLSEIAP